MRSCECGCGGSIPDQDERGRPRRYVRGHSNRGKSNTWLVTENPTTRTSRERANKAVGPGPCELERIGGCAGRKEAHHRDENPLNNDPANLIRLCQVHHRLCHSGRIDLADPVMPAFRVGRDGKRRYEPAAS